MGTINQCPNCHKTDCLEIIDETEDGVIFKCEHCGEEL